MSASIEVEVANRQRSLPCDASRLVQGVRSVLSGEGVASATISVAVVDDAAIHELNRRYLAHDWPTDVLSFELERRHGKLEGEIVVSAETAARAAADYGQTPDDELLLYVIHGALHLAGYDDATRSDRQKMRDREKHYLHRMASTMSTKT